MHVLIYLCKFKCVMFMFLCAVVNVFVGMSMHVCVGLDFYVYIFNYKRVYICVCIYMPLCVYACRIAYMCVWRWVWV